MQTDNVRRLLKANDDYAATFAAAHLSVTPSLYLCIVTCHDARIDPLGIFGLTVGDAHIIRNGGGNARDGLRSILISQHMLGTREIVLIKHTDCGTASFTNEAAHLRVAQNCGEEVLPRDFAFAPFLNAESSVKAEVAWLRGHSALIEGTEVSGLVYDVHTGKAKQVA